MIAKAIKVWAMNTPPPSERHGPGCFYDRDNFRHDKSVGQLLRMATISVRQQADRQLVPHGLTHAQWVPLFKIANGEAVNVVMLARDMGIDPGAMTRALSRLEDKGLLRRVRSDADRRCVQLEATEAGQAVARQVWGVLADVLNAHLSGFSHDELDLLTSLLQRMVANGEVLRQQQSDNEVKGFA
jgi:DNA-binding MarR family transcriptional regulator